jgi:hypothetical protein
MTSPDLSERFRSLGEMDVPDIHTLGTDRHRVLWIMTVGQQHVGETWFTAPQISTVLRDVYGVAVPWQRVQAILAGEQGTVAGKRFKAGVRYQVMKAGRDEITSATSVIFVEPASALSGLRQVQDLFGNLPGTLKICDPYLSSPTFDMLAHCERATSFQLLTMKVDAKDDIPRDIKAFRTQHGPLEVRVGARGQLHDRYMIHDKGMLLVGTSLNSIGLKQSFVVDVGQDIRAMVVRSFNDMWAKATPI